jgi:hypothetical protein
MLKVCSYFFNVQKESGGYAYFNLVQRLAIWEAGLKNCGLSTGKTGNRVLINRGGH